MKPIDTAFSHLLLSSIIVTTYAEESLSYLP